MSNPLTWTYFCYWWHKAQRMMITKMSRKKVWTMEMLMNDNDILRNMMNEEESMSEDEKKFLYARAVHSNHSIQYHMHQIME